MIVSLDSALGVMRTCEEVDPRETTDALVVPALYVIIIEPGAGARKVSLVGSSQCDMPSISPQHRHTPCVSS